MSTGVWLYDRDDDESRRGASIVAMDRLDAVAGVYARRKRLMLAVAMLAFGFGPGGDRRGSSSASCSDYGLSLSAAPLRAAMDAATYCSVSRSSAAFRSPLLAGSP